MEDRGTHSGTACFVKALNNGRNHAWYQIWEYSMRCNDVLTSYKNVYMVRCVWDIDNSVVSEFLYETYEKACKMVEYFMM